MGMFSFDPSKGETPQSIAMKREIAMRLAGTTKAPNSIGTGLSAIADALSYRGLMDDVTKGQAAGDTSSNSAFAPIFSALSGKPQEAAPTLPQPSAPPVNYSPNQIEQTPISGSHSEFIKSITPKALEVAQRTGVDPKIILAQAAHESAWGAKAPKNNLFGIKGVGDAGSQNVATHESVNGQMVPTHDNFAAYTSPSASLDGYGDFLTKNKRYAPMRAAQGFDAQLEALGKSGYATDPNYTNKIRSIASGLNIQDQGAEIEPASYINRSKPNIPITSQMLNSGAPMAGQTPPLQQVAQAAPEQGGNSLPDMGTLLKIAQDPWVSQDTAKMQIIQSLMTQQMNANDPSKELERRKMAIELQNLEHPEQIPMSAKDAAQLKLEQDKFGWEQNKPQVVGSDSRLYGGGKVLLDAMPKEDKKTAEQQNYEYALEQLKTKGVPQEKLPTFQEWSKPKSRGIVFKGADGTEVRIGGDGDNTGMDGTSIPAEVGSRIGLGQEFLQNDYAAVKKAITDGEATGLIDNLAGKFGRGSSGDVQRRMATGADALKRGLTGAGMSIAESNDYAARYQPTLTDDVPTLLAKLEGLKSDLEAVATGAIKGKAGRVTDLLPKKAPIISNGYTIEEVQ